MKKTSERSEKEGLEAIEQLLRACEDFEPDEPMPSGMAGCGFEPRPSRIRRFFRRFPFASYLQIAAMGAATALIVLALSGAAGFRADETLRNNPFVMNRPETRVEMVANETPAKWVPVSPVVRRVPDANLSAPQPRTIASTPKRANSKTGSPWSFERIERTFDGAVAPGWTTRRDAASGAQVVMPVLVPVPGSLVGEGSVDAQP